MKIPQFAVRNPVAMVMLFAGFCLLGYLSLDRLGIDLLPDISTPKVVVTLKAADLSPQELEEKYGRSMEAVLSTVSHVEHVSTVSRIGRLVCTVEFAWDSDMDFALLDVQKNVGYLQSDRDVEELTVSRFDPNAEPVIIVGLSAPKDDRSLEAIRSLAEHSLKPTLERLDGVALVRVSGGREPEVEVRVDPYRLEATGLTMDDLSFRIKAANLDSAGGTIEDNEKVYIVKGLGAFRSVEDVQQLVVGFRQPDRLTSDLSAGTEKVPILLSDVAEVTLGEKEVRNVVHVDGREGVGVAVYKEPERNTVLVVKSVEDTLARWRATAPGLTVTTVRDQARFIRASISELESAAGIGIILAVVVLYLFLWSVRSTLIVSISIPISIVMTFVLMYFDKLTLNIMTLGGLALGAGMLVDNAIVVVENTFRHMEEGTKPMEAAVVGTSEVSNAIMASTLTNVVVFLPIVFVKGVAAQLFKDQAFTVCFSLLASLVVAFLLVPVLTSRWLKPMPPRLGRIRSRWYWDALSWCLDHKGAMVLVTALAMAGMVLLYVNLGAEFIPKADQGEFALRVELPPGTRVEMTRNVVSRIERETRNRFPDAIRAMYSDIGERSVEDLLRAEEDLGENTADIHIALVPFAERTISSSQMIQEIEPILKTVPDLEYRVLSEGSAVQVSLGSESRPLTVEVLGDDLDEIAAVTRSVAAMMPDLNQGGRKVYNIRTSFEGGQDEARLRIDRLMAGMFDLTVEGIAKSVKAKLSGEVVTEYFTGEEEREVRLRVPDRGIDELMDLEIETPTGTKVKLKELGKLELGRGPGTVRRKDGSRVGLVTADLAEGASFSGTAAALEAGLTSLRIPPDMRIVVGGEERARRESFASLRFAAILAVVLVYMVMAAQFESFLHPLVIMLTMPLAGLGAVLAFYVAGMSLNIMGIIGLIMLAGIAVNNAIVLIDFTNQLRDKGLGAREALLQASQARIRPILMTSLTAILGLLPLAFGIGEGASLRAPMAVAVIGGLISSTILTLGVIPVFYLLAERLRPRKRPDVAG